MIFIGDIHGAIHHAVAVAENHPDETVLQVGDFGIFNEWQAPVFPFIPNNLKMFPGNHDNRDYCNTLPFCIGDYGEFEDIFFISGASSIDASYRIEGVDWWRNEELNYSQFQDALDKWEKSDKMILVSHDCPQSLASELFHIHDTSSTRTMLDHAIEIKKPEMIIFGHHHRTHYMKWNNIEVRALGINTVFKLT